MKEIKFIWMIIIFFGSFVLFAIYLNIDQIFLQNFCRDKDYDSSEYEDVELGYVQCCSDVYENHVKTGESCEVYKYDKVSFLVNT